jgi:hypothetical protein
MGLRLLSMTLCLGVTGMAGAGPSPLDEARSVLEQWVRTRQLVAKTQADWVAEKDVLEASARVFERELQDLDARVTGLGEASAQVARERQELQSEKEALEQATLQARTLATRFETRLRDLRPWLPEPLDRRVAPLFERFPEDPESTRLTVAERLQNLVGLLNEIDKFNGSVVVESEIRKNDQGLEVQVETLYLGLAQAYFVGEGGRFAGVALPTGNGWQTTPRNDLGPTIERAVAMYRNQSPAALLALPFEVR